MSVAPEHYSFVRYLLAKRTVDDRALNQRVVERLRQLLMAESFTRPRVVELGAGVGTMVTRLANWDVVERADYVLVDEHERALAAARQELQSWSEAASANEDELSVRRGRTDLTIRLELGDALEFAAADRNRQRFDLVFANAVLDLFDLEKALPRIFRCLAPEGLFWFSINFDGDTIFVPEDPLDAAIVGLYHRSMEPPLRSGSSTTGRRLLEAIPSLGATLLAAGSSDWVVFPTEHKYPADEAYFLHHIVHTIHRALAGHPELEADRFERWIEARHRQVELGALSYVAHQLDVLGRPPRA